MSCGSKVPALPADTLLRARARSTCPAPARYPRSLPTSPARQKERPALPPPGACTATISIFLTPCHPTPWCCSLTPNRAQERKPEVPRLRRARKQLAAPRRRPGRRQPAGHHRRPARRPVAPRLRRARKQPEAPRRRPVRRQPAGRLRRLERKQLEAPRLRRARKPRADRLRRLERKPRADLLLPQVSLLVAKAGYRHGRRGSTVSR
jgi:hypothetical protein